MKTLITLLIILAASQVTVSIGDSETALRNLVEQAQITAYAIKAPTNFHIQYKLVDAMPESDMTGVCVEKMKVVKISKTWFESKGDKARLTLIAHEMAHCEYSVDHKETGLMAANTEFMVEDASHFHLNELLEEALNVK